MVDLCRFVYGEGDYKKIKELGQGGFGSVYLAKHIKTNRLYAVKEIVSESSDFFRAGDGSSIAKEAQILSSLDHPCVVAFHESYYSVSRLRFVIVQGYCDGGSLGDKIKSAKKEKINFTESQITRWFTQIMMGVEYIHSKRILHRDLKPQNVFCLSNDLCKIGDFGISKVLASTLDAGKTFAGTPFYLSPEMCEDKPYTSKADVWACGCILHELCSLKPPFSSNSLCRLGLKIVTETHPPLPSRFSRALNILADDLLSKDPDKRPSAKRVVSSAVIKQALTVFLKEAAEKKAAAPQPRPLPKTPARFKIRVVNEDMVDGVSEWTSSTDNQAGVDSWEEHQDSLDTMESVEDDFQTEQLQQLAEQSERVDTGSTLSDTIVDDNLPKALAGIMKSDRLLIDVTDEDDLSDSSSESRGQTGEESEAGESLTSINCLGPEAISALTLSPSCNKRAGDRPDATTTPPPSPTTPAPADVVLFH